MQNASSQSKQGPRLSRARCSLLAGCLSLAFLLSLLWCCKLWLHLRAFMLQLMNILPVSARFQAHLQNLPCDCQVATFSFKQVTLKKQINSGICINFTDNKRFIVMFFFFSVHEVGHSMRIHRLSRAAQTASAFIFILV